MNLCYDMVGSYRVAIYRIQCADNGSTADNAVGDHQKTEAGGVNLVTKIRLLGQQFGLKCSMH